ncbi:MAG TPA: sodium:solute symporter family protein [Gemmatimonadales bacterium]|jgi:SSS family transporter|nr:sodium:solute symporter family protein [Gemmatimonadales bacterium]
MTLELSDWLIVGLYFIASAGIALIYTRRASQSLDEYFVSGRALPWWLAGTSMVATTFAADTPLVVAGLVAKYGVAGNWLWWNGALSGILTVFFFARLWRRAGVLTDLEFAELRYGGKPAAVLRGFRALYLALPVNLIIMGWVTRAMVTILHISLNIDPWTAAILLFAVTGAYSIFSGLWGVVVTDTFQFVVKMGGVIVLAIFAVNSVGGLDPMVQKVSAHFGSYEAAFGVLPPVDKAWLPLSTLIVFLSVQWWAAWYPGAEPGGGGYVAQRILAAKDERHGLLATLWFQIAHYALRPWPWILVGFVAVIRYPGLLNPEEGYVRVMVDVLPSPMKGLLLATFAAAYMSTIGTHLNWGASYLVNDVYLRFIRPQASRRAQVLASRFATVTLMLLSLVVMAYLQSVEQGWKLLIGLGAGTGLVFILRWYWWRVNAWSEISAMAASFVTSVVLHLIGVNAGDTSSKDYAIAMTITVGITTAVWLTVTFLTAPEPDAVLDRFYRKVRPGGVGWRPVSTRLGFGDDRIPGGALSWVNWVAGVTAVFTALFGVGAFLTGTALQGMLYSLVSIAAFALIMRNLRADDQLAASVDRTQAAGLGFSQSN